MEQSNNLFDENERLHEQLTQLEEEYAEMKEDYNRRRSQAKRYQKSAKRRQKRFERYAAVVAAVRTYMHNPSEENITKMRSLVYELDLFEDNNGKAWGKE